MLWYKINFIHENNEKCLLLNFEYLNKDIIFLNFELPCDTIFYRNIYFLSMILK